MADLERDGGGFLRGLERKMRGLSVVGTWRGIAYSENALLAYCTQWPVFGRAMRRHQRKGIGHGRESDNRLSAERDCSA